MNEEDKSKIREIGKMAKEAINIGEKRTGNPLEGLVATISRLEQFAQYIDGTMKMLAKTADFSHLTDRLIVKILIEKGLITEEEFEKRFKEEVIDVYKDMEERTRQEIKKKLEEQMEKDKKEDEELAETVQNVISITDKKEQQND